MSGCLGTLWEGIVEDILKKNTEARNHPALPWIERAFEAVGGNIREREYPDV